MTAAMWVALAGAMWTVVAVGVGVLIGRMVRRRDRQIPRDEP